MIPIPNIPVTLVAKLGVALTMAIALGLLVHDRNHWKAEAGLRQQQLAANKAAFDQTVAGYRAAAAEAKADDAANISRVAAEQTAISERTVDEYETRIAAARAAARRLHDNQTAATDSGRVGIAPVPRLPAAAEGASEAAGEDQLPGADKLTATEQAIQLDELIKWVRGQHAVDPNTAH